MSTMTAVRGDFDEDGFHLYLEADDGDEACDLRVADPDTARALLREVSRLRPWIEEHDRERAAYQAASPEERRRVLDREEEDDPGERARDAGDIARKRAKEDG